MPVELLQRVQPDWRPPERLAPRSIRTIGVSQARHYDATATPDNKCKSSISFIRFLFLLETASGRRRVSGEHVIAILGRLVTREASFVQGLVAGFTILEISKSPPSSRAILF